MEITIDGHKLEAKSGETILAVARRAGIHIPTLCHHDALEPVGACRVCVVEISRKSRDERLIVTSCQYPVEDGLLVFTDSPAVAEQRLVTLSLLAGRAPKVEMIRKLAEPYGELIEYKRGNEDEKCILCYLCTRACAAVGADAIAAVGRGLVKEISPPFGKAAESCIGCGACHRICPTNCIDMEEKGDVRRIWGREFELVKCEVCGAPVMTKAHMEHAVSRFGLDESYYSLCSRCKRDRLAKRMSTIGVVDGAAK